MPEFAHEIEDDPHGSLAGAATPRQVVAEAFENLGSGPTWIVGENLREGMRYVSSLSRAEAVQLMIEASAATMQGGTRRK